MITDAHVNNCLVCLNEQECEDLNAILDEWYEETLE